MTTIDRVGDCPDCGGTTRRFVPDFGWVACRACQGPGTVPARKRDADAMLERVRVELHRIIDKRVPFVDAHQLESVLGEEVFEFKMEVYKKEDRRKPDLMRAELVQIAAVAIRGASELLSDEGGE